MTANPARANQSTLKTIEGETLLESIKRGGLSITETKVDSVTANSKRPTGTSGWIKVHRQIQDNPLWNHKPADPARAWIDLILMAAWEPHEIWIRGTVYTLGRGEIAASIRFLGNRWGWGHSKTASFLASLAVQNQLVKIRDGSGNGSPSIYRIVNYDTYQSEPAPHRDGSADACRTLAGRLQDKTKKDKKGKNIKPSVFFSDFLQKFPAEDQELFTELVKAISSTRKSGKVADSVLDKLASQLSAYPKDHVLNGLRTYLEKDYAAEGKNERYLVGIVRQLAKRNGDGFKGQVLNMPPKTEVQIAMDRAMQELQQEHQQ